MRRIETYTAYVEAYPPPKGWSNVDSVGWMLNRLVGRTIEGHRLATKKVKGITRYTVEPS